jgi:hypothetical protein
MGIRYAFAVAGAIAIFLASGPSTMAADTAIVVVSYVEGEVERQAANGKWVELDVGHKLPVDAIVRLAEASILEFTDGRLRVVISASGSYKIADIYAKAVAFKRDDGGVLDKLKGFTPGGPDSASVAAVRGTGQSGAYGSGFSYDDEGATAAPAAMFEAALAKSVEGDREGALALFLETASSGSEPWASTSAYFAAMAYVEMGMPARAISYLRSYGIDRSMAAYGLCTLALARLDAEAGAYDEARALLEAALASGKLTDEEAKLARATLALLP